MALPDRIQAAQGVSSPNHSLCAFVVPFLPFPIKPFRLNNAVSDTHGDSERQTAWVEEEFPKSEKQFPRSA